MALYDFECEHCRAVKEMNFRAGQAPDVLKCGICDHIMHRLFKPSGNFILNGDGWTRMHHESGYYKDRLEEDRKAGGKKFKDNDIAPEFKK